MNKSIGMLRAKGLPGPKAKAMAYVSQVKGLKFYYFTPEHVDIKNKKIQAFTLMNNQWVKELIDYPNVIDNDIRSLKNKAVCDDLMLYSHFTTQILGGKLKTLKLIQSLPAYQNIIIPYELVSSEQQLKSFLEKNQYIVVKPTGGNQGKNILFIRWGEDRFEVNHSGKKIDYPKQEFSIFYQQEIKGRNLIAQKYISSLTATNQAFDLRVHVQRNGKCEWEVTKIYARIGSGKGLIANLSAGGSMADGRLFLQYHFHDNFKDIYNEVKHIGENLPRDFQQFYSQEIDSLGIDLGVDTSGNLWLFEINSFPGSKYFEFERALTRVDYLEALLIKNRQFEHIEQITALIKEDQYRLVVDNRKLKGDNNIVLLKTRTSKTGMPLANIQKNVNQIKTIIYDSVQFDPSQVPYDIKCISVANIDQCVFQIAKRFREEFIGNIYTVVGSVGKTSTSTLLSQMLKKLDTTTTLNLKGNTPFYIANGMSDLKQQNHAVFEVAGAGLLDEKPIGLVSHELLQPKICIFTALAPAHIEKIGSMKNIAERKATAFKALPADSILIINRDVEYFEFMLSFVPKHVKIYSFGMHPDSDFKLLTHGDDYIEINMKGIPLKVQLNEPSLEIRMNCLGIMAALSIMFPETWQTSLPVLNTLTKIHGRGKEIQSNFKGNLIQIIDDSYNANPTSMKTALLSFSQLARKNKIVVISEMLELGEFSLTYHQQIIDLIEELKFDNVILIGHIFEQLKISYSDSKHICILTTIDQLEDELDNVVAEGCTVFFKGSNSTGLNNFVKNNFYDKKNLVPI